MTDTLPPHIAADLLPRELAFCRYRASGLSLQQAAERAGYSPGSPRSAKSTAAKLMKRPRVQAAITWLQQATAARTQYDVAAAMKELDSLAQFSRETKNATALARAAELRMKLCGLLDNRDSGTALANTFIEALQAARDRRDALYAVEVKSPPAIEAEIADAAAPEDDDPG